MIPPQKPTLIIKNAPKKKGNSAWIFVLSLVLIIALGYFYAYPTYKTWSQNKDSLSQAQSQLNTLQQQKTEVTQSIDNMNKASGLDNLDLAIPAMTSNTIPDLYANIETLAKASNLTLASIQAQDQSSSSDNSTPGVVGAGTSGAPVAGTTGAPTGPALPSGVGSIQVNIQLKGGVDQFNQFLASIEQNLRLMDVQSVDVVGGGADQQQLTASSPSVLTFNVQLITYYQK